MILDEVQTKLATGGNSPHELADLKVTLAAHFSYLAGILETCLVEKAKLWPELRKGANSDATASRKWEATERGLEEIKTRLQMKRCEKMMSAITSLLKVSEGEARNLY